MSSITITADASATAFGNGISLRVEVLANAASSQTGAAANSITAMQKAITTTAIGSRVYGAAINNNTAFNANGSQTTVIDNIADVTNSVRYATCKQTTDTTSTGSETIGSGSTRHDGGIALFEILSNGKALAEDITAPPVKTVTTGSVATTAAFSPPLGSLLVAMVAAPSGNIALTDSSGLTWTEQSKIPNGDGYAGIWTARVAAPQSGDPYIAAIGGMSGTSSVALNVVHDVAVGDVLVAETSFSSGTLSSIVDSQSNTWASGQLIQTSQNNENRTSKVTTGLTVAGSDTITVTRSGSTGQGNVIIVGIPGAIASSPVEGSSVSKTSSGSSTTPSVTSGTLGQASEILISCMTASNAAKSVAWSSPFDGGVLASEQIVTSALLMSVAWERATSTTAVTSALTLTGTTPPWELMLTAIKVNSPSAGSVAMHKQGLSDAGIETFKGTGSVARHKMGIHITGTGNSSVSGTSAPSRHKMGLSGIGTEKIIGIVSVSMHKMSLSDSGTEIFTATGSVAMHKQVLSDTGTEKFIGTGTVARHKMALASSGNEIEVATGSVAMHKQVMHGLAAGVVVGTASVARHKMGLSAYGDPASIRLDNSAEGGTNGTAVSTANSGGTSGSPFDIVSIGALSAVTVDNTHPIHGSLGYKYVTGSPAANAILGWSSPFPNLVMIAFARKYFYMTAYPATNQLRVIRALSSGTVRACIAINTTGHVLLIDSTNATRGTSVGVVPLNAPYRLEAKFIGDGSVGQVECRMFTTHPEGIVPDEVVTSTAVLNNGGTINRIDWGNPSSQATYTYWSDDPAVSTRGYPGPVPMASIARHKMGVASTGSYVGPVLYNDFSGLGNGVTITTGNSGGASGRAFDSISATAGGTMAGDNTHLGLDIMAFKVATAATVGAQIAQWSKAGSLGYDRTKMYFRCDQLITTAATPAFRPFSLRTTAGTHIFSPLISGNTVSCSYGSAFNGLTAFTGSIANNQYFRLEGFVDITAGTVHIELYTSQKDAIPAQVKDFTSVAFGNNIQRIDVGNANSAASDGPFWIDAVAFSDTGSISPPHVSMHKMGIAASGGEKETGISSVARHKMGIAAAGHVAYGSMQMHKMGLSDSGTEKFIGTGSVARHKMGLGSAGKEIESGTGSSHMHKMSIAATGTGTASAVGTVSVHMHKMGVSGSGVETDIGTGHVSMHKMALAGTEVETFFGVGGVQARKMGVSARGEFRLVFHLSGGVAMRKMQVLGQTPPIESSSLFVFSPV